VVVDENDCVRQIQVKTKTARSNWIWGAFKMPGWVMQELHELWQERHGQDEYFGTLVNEYLARGGQAKAVKAGERYVDIGTLNGYRSAIQLLSAEHKEKVEWYDPVKS
jgi:glucose-1-phosphate thymidylyltransferase